MFLRDEETGGAWLSSARVVRCWLSPATSATLIVSCQQVKLGTLARLPAISRRKVGTTSNHHAPYILGYTRTTMAVTEGSETARWSKSPKAAPVRIAG